MKPSDQLAAKMLEYSLAIKTLIDDIKRVESDGQLDAQTRLTQISDIRTRISDIGTLLDNARREVILLGNLDDRFEIN